jgi:hypothetical protein
MAVKHIDLTLSGATPITATAATRKGIQHIIIQNTAGNAAIFIGDSTVSSTSYGHTLAAGGILHIGPFSSMAPLNTAGLYIKGTDAQVVHILVVTH